ncbi:MAG: DNA-binding domain-containing protein [Myxococcota bacterium]|nr:DNA-binding domain-containing protein [Myxococcota bacterium]
MSELDRLQHFISAALRRRRDLSNDPVIVAEAERDIDATSHFSPARHLEIYREQFWLRHTHSLLEDFPGIAGILGQAQWERLVEEYLLAHPPTSFSLRDLGEKLPAFLESADFLAHRELVLDMGRLEWAHIEVFDAPALPPLSPEAVTTLDEEALASARLVLSPALRLLHLSYPVPELRNRLLSAKGSPVDLPLPEPSPSRLVLYRRELSTVHCRLRRAPFALLEALSRGVSLGNACELVCALGDAEAASVEREVATWFADWVARGFIVAVR